MDVLISPHIVTFYLCLVVASGIATVLGGTTERQVAVMLVIATVASKLAAWSTAGHFAEFEVTLFLVDLTLLIGLGTIALTSDRYWPLWLTALHAYTVMAHLARVIVPDTLTAVYLSNSALTAYPGLVLLTVGALRHCRRAGRCRGHRPPLT